MESRSRLENVFNKRRVGAIPKSILVRGAERLLVRQLNGFDEKRGTAMKWAIREYAFPYYPLNDTFSLFNLKGPNEQQDRVVLVGDGEKITIRRLSDRQCQANILTGSYTVGLADVADLTARKESSMEDSYRGLLEVFPGVEISFAEELKMGS